MGCGLAVAVSDQVAELSARPAIPHQMAGLLGRPVGGGVCLGCCCSAGWICRGGGKGSGPLGCTVLEEVADVAVRHAPEPSGAPHERRRRNPGASGPGGRQPICPAYLGPATRRRSQARRCPAGWSACLPGRQGRSKRQGVGRCERLHRRAAVATRSCAAPRRHPHPRAAPGPHLEPPAGLPSSAEMIVTARRLISPYFEAAGSPAGRSDQTRRQRYQATGCRFEPPGGPNRCRS
jgi:hypothetical protein